VVVFIYAAVCIIMIIIRINAVLTAAAAAVVGSPGLSDPCEKELIDATDCLTNQQKEEVTASAQV